MTESLFSISVSLSRLMAQREDLLREFAASKEVNEQVRLGNAIEALENQIIAEAAPREMEKVDSVRGYRLHASMMQAAAKEEKDRQAANERHWRATLDFLDRCILQTCEATGRDRLEGKHGYLRAQLNSAAPAPIISQPDLVPLSLCTVTVEFRGDIWDNLLDNFAVIDRALETGTAKIKERAPSASLIKAELEKPCGECGGSGEIVNDGPHSPCDDCGGTGMSAVAGCSLPPKGKHVRIGA